MQRALPCALVAAAVFVCYPLTARPAENTPSRTKEDTTIRRAPLGLRTQGPLRELFLDITGGEARALRAVELDVRLSTANTWNESMTLVRGSQRAVQELREQADSLAVRLRAPWSRLLGPGPEVLGRPLWERLSTAIEGRVTEHWGGFTDGAIEAWHRLVGAFNFNRAKYPRDQVHLVYKDGGGAAFDIRSGTLAVGDVAVRTQLSIIEGGQPLTESASRCGLSLRLDFKVPVGAVARAGGSGGFDAGAGLLATAELLPWLTAHGLVALSYFSPLAAPTLLQPKPWHLTAELSLAAAIGGTTLLFEDRVVSPLLPPSWKRLPSGGPDGLLSSGLYAGFRPHNQVSFAIRRWGFSLWLSEDFTPGPNPSSTMKWAYESNAPDVVVGLAYTRQL